MSAAKVIEFSSLDSPTTLYACGWCRHVVPVNTRQAAEECCTCTRCGSRLAEHRRHYTTCLDCDASARADRETARRATEMAKPVAGGHDGPVYVDDWGEFFDDAEAALDRCHDDDIDPATLLAYPCMVRKAPVPDLADAVSDLWAEQFDDPDPNDVELSERAAQAVAEVTALLEMEAPSMWVPDWGKRVDLGHDTSRWPRGERPG